MASLTHLDETGAATMVDVGAKAVSERVAVAEGQIVMLPATLDLALSGTADKGDVAATARIAGIMAAKRTRSHSRGSRSTSRRTTPCPASASPRSPRCRAGPASRWRR